MYYLTSGVEVFEWRFAWSPAWNSVGRHVRFNRELVERSEGYLRRAFGLEEGEEVPPVSAIFAFFNLAFIPSGVPGFHIIIIVIFFVSVR
jgi:hypothetical protein